MTASGFSKARRLRIAREFDAVFKTATWRVSSAHFLVLARENGLSDSRVGTVVSKKVAKNSVNRNRIRRLIKESFRIRFQGDPLDIVIVARPAAGASENAQISQALINLWRQLIDRRSKTAAQ